MNVAHVCSTFRWIRCIVYPAHVGGYDRVCQPHYRVTFFNLVFVSKMRTQRQKQLSSCDFYLVDPECRSVLFLHLISTFEGSKID